MARRLKKELKKITDPKQKKYAEYATIREHCTINPNDSNILEWEVILKGPAGSPYEGHSFAIEMTFPAQYPHKPPDVKNKTSIPHPNTNEAGTEWCRDLWAKDWGPTLDAGHVLGVIIQTLKTPNLESPVNPALAKLWSEDEAAAVAEIKAKLSK